VSCSPAAKHIANARPAGPLLSFFNHDAWTDEPAVHGAVLIGDAAGWNDPNLGQGLSSAYRDVRLVAAALTHQSDWSPCIFREYVEERAERMRRLRFAASLQSRLEVEFGEAAQARRANLYRRARTDRSLMAHVVPTCFAGPETAPAEAFTEDHWRRVLHG
jgi:menaquinone-9 beta-reductase